ncbi:MAG TPA: hypothetical protein VMZ74_10225 [Ramlibacter sp.]|nr:hypothetical protein [Ramlibacter sp.]
MQPTTPVISASIIPVPKIDIDEPVAVIPIASVAPLDGPPDGERIYTFALAPKNDTDVIGDLRERVLGKPLTYAAAAFSLGFIVARVLR